MLRAVLLSLFSYGRKTTKKQTKLLLRNTNVTGVAYVGLGLFTGLAYRNKCAATVVLHIYDRAATHCIQLSAITLNCIEDDQPSTENR